MNVLRSTAALALTTMALPMAVPHAQSLGEMAGQATTNLDAVGPLLSGIFYLVGACISVLGFIKFKRHVDNPQQVSIANCFVTVLVGVALISAPFIINSLAGTFGATSTDVERPRFQ